MQTSPVRLGALIRYVSFRHAPKFRQPRPEEVIGLPVKETPPHCVPAFVLPDFINEAEERALLALTEPWFSRLPCNEGHMDALIHHYKEFYRSYKGLMEGEGACGSCEDGCRHVRRALERCWSAASGYVPATPLDDRVHFLRLSECGFIRAHADDTRNSSGIIAGLCLGSARVMTLTHPDHAGQRVELMLAPRAFYVLMGAARYKWEHSVDWIRDDDEHIERVRGRVPPGERSLVFDGKETEFRRGERTAIIFRGVSPLELLKHKTLERKGHT
ncbi:2OG-Fe(II) oxygenase superfamily, putative [Trypanosoma equiperdum]|uniref:Uncharacterized protein n=3 Tax=Trypanozoon TaxID=39700 RepID=Q383D9_TRYB2|nr:hypothetical protein, conserved [Trypanosoma brucei gambiense DAL972]XP_829204.1 hypothetical protein, conserved [Trypanosoma brucei brucei TREU927]EAN80092.1 hypothetical protein, conserved [Trypanosoma brucei brucei TREU927]CBH18152.1 hypothetical protein, conserved [Trypanosoma brucei gambiense DAL972]SCU67578.1 2OG-Fe(II) oxygenase superfamily, putative [Trypanosoma equiperdum]|eukprot:XP_011780416.1 hypothetical protein, conserved [Trypanosoma brucei gambiense DAL972]